MAMEEPLPPVEQGEPVRTAEEESAKQAELLQQELTLTPAQKEQAYKIFLKYAHLRRANEAITQEEAIKRATQMKAELLKIMTPEQQTQYISNKRVPMQRPARICMETTKDKE